MTDPAIPDAPPPRPGPPAVLNVAAVVRWCLAVTLIATGAMAGIASGLLWGGAVAFAVAGAYLVLPATAVAMPWRAQLVARFAAMLVVCYRIGPAMPVMLAWWPRLSDFAWSGLLLAGDAVAVIAAMALLPLGSWRSWRCVAEPAALPLRTIVVRVLGVAGAGLVLLGLSLPWLVKRDEPFDPLVWSSVAMLGRVTWIPVAVSFLAMAAALCLSVAALATRGVPAVAFRIGGGLLLPLAAVAPVEAISRFVAHQPGHRVMFAPLGFVAPVVMVLGMAALLVGLVAAPYQGLALRCAGGGDGHGIAGS